MSFKTADLCDIHGDKAQVAEPIFVDFGGKISFHGRISTIKCFEDNSLVRSAFETPGDRRVLVIDGGGSMRCALVGDQLALLARKNGWAGAIVNGCIRDSADISAMEIGLKALAAHPRKSVKKGVGECDIAVHFADVTFTPDHYVYADDDGIIVASEPLLD